MRDEGFLLVYMLYIVLTFCCVGVESTAKERDRFMNSEKNAYEVVLLCVVLMLCGRVSLCSIWENK